MAHGVGAALRDERLRREIALDEISRQTRISQRFLKAIENEDFEQLPGIVFTRNFVRQYADTLGIDAEPLLAQLPRVDVADVTVAMAPSAGRTTAWDPRWNSAFSTVAWLVLASGAAIGAYIHFNQPAATHAGNTTPVSRAQPKPDPVTPPAPVETPVVSAVPAPPPATPPLSTERRPVEVVLTAHQESWVQVSADGKVAFTATLKPNDSRTVEADQQVKVVTGNAGGIGISLNGKPLEPLGPSGQVRTVRLTAEGPQFPPKTPPTTYDPL